MHKMKIYQEIWREDFKLWFDSSLFTPFAAPPPGQSHPGGSPTRRRYATNATLQPWSRVGFV